jgi:hypothetical protein
MADARMDASAAAFGGEAVNPGMNPPVNELGQ